MSEDSVDFGEAWWWKGKDGFMGNSFGMPTCSRTITYFSLDGLGNNIQEDRK